ncbi:mannitol dehydrogenase family protein [Mesorhizobium sp. BR1-1-16]|uniref:mannitol dehydrogenase family protein n=1 Tax=Mesorhizobium sp. BR1-1-16 TaxID=2876653 RepID=UPI001CCBA087|nr:mannitol dehydrogenase family protein [Mesorhizobium sp. BR1-1-16]MBZ9938362.1 mannitol dehydrogenase family protein [Mesorhizobium sp. BR1-1-16]
MAIKLSTTTLPAIAATARVPHYDRAALSAGILHFGIGNFHRAHQAAYLDDLFSTGRDFDFAIIGTGVTGHDGRIAALLADQDLLTTLVEQEATSSLARVTGSMIATIAPGDREKILDTLADPSIRIVSLTVTEGGYFINAATAAFDPQNPQIVADAADPEHAKTVFGLIIAGLRRRRDAGIIPFTVMSCDNLPHNGTVARNAVVGLAALSDPAFAAWIKDNVAFPNGMVDRITPATGDREKQLLADQFGIEDAWPVFCEDFRQWVLEDNFPAGRPHLEDVGVQFVPDVTPFEMMKIRILNGGHAVIAYAGGLLDIHFVHEAMEHPLVAGFLEKVETEEIVPVVPPVPDTDISAYFELIKHRFANPKIGDTVRRLCLDGSNRQPKFIIPTIADRLSGGLPITGLALESALWCRYCFGTTDSGATIAPNDPNWERLTATAALAKDDPLAWLAMEDLYGAVGQNDVFRKAFSEALTALWRDGTAATLTRYLAA